MSQMTSTSFYVIEKNILALGRSIVLEEEK